MAHPPPGLAPYYLSPKDKNADYEPGAFYKKNIAEAKKPSRPQPPDTLQFKLRCNVDRHGAEAQQA
jgi:hypothetical protein